MKKSNRRGAPIVWLVGANPKAVDRERALVRSGFRVSGGPWSSPEIARKKKVLPAAVVVDLSRAPSVGRDVAVAMRSHRALVPVPFLLIGGTAEHIAQLTALIPDAIGSDWTGVVADIRRVLESPPSGGRQLSIFDVYAGTPLWKKLGVKPGGRIVALNRPDSLGALLGQLPDGATISPSGSGARDLTLWFVRSQKELATRIHAMREFARSGGLWIMWRKDGDGSVNQIVVRKAGLACGLVDFKITRLDETWSGLRFTVRT